MPDILQMTITHFTEILLKINKNCEQNVQNFVQALMC